MTQKSAILFCIGQELLEGLVLDRNAHFMAGRLNDLGVRVLSIQVLDDDEQEMVSAFQAALKRKPGYILTTGGLGPGNDDLTRQCVAKAIGKNLKTDPRAIEMLSRAYRRLYAMGVVNAPELNDVRLRMAELPEGSTPVENPIGTAPLIRVTHGPTTFYLLPGVPEEMRQLLTQHVLPAVTAEGSGNARESRHIAYPGRDESAVARVLENLKKKYPTVQSRSRVQGSEEEISIRVTLLGEHANQEELRRLLDKAEAELRAQIGATAQPSHDRDDTDY